MCFEEDRQDERGQQTDRAVGAIDQNPKLFEPPQRRQDVHLLRRQKLYLSRTRTLLLWTTLQLPEKEEKSTIRYGQIFSTADLQSVGLYALQRDHPPRSETLECHIPLRKDLVM